MQDRYDLIILPEAQNDIRETVLYVARDLAAPRAALDLQDALQGGIDSLANMPERIKIVDDQPWRDAGVRKIRIENYYIYFVITESAHEVRILAVIYVGRDQNRQMQERGMDVM